MNILIKNGRIIDPATRTDRVFDSYHCIKLHAKSLEAA